MTRRSISFLLCMTLLVGCGSPAAVQPSAPTSVPTVLQAEVAEPAAVNTSAPTVAVEPTVSSTVAPVATEEATTAPTASETAVANAADGVFPVTIEHKFGSTEITSAPQRIVTVGLTDQDALFALGIVPVGVTEFFGNYPHAIGPWAQDEVAALGDMRPTVVGDASAINFENIVALNPDLILALYAGLTEDDYKLLVQIAPTVAQPDAYVDYGIPWQEQTRIIGQAVGRAAQAEGLIAGVDDHFAQARADHPEFVGARVVVATPYEGIAIYSRQDPRSRTFTSLGLEIPAEFDAIVGDQFYGNLSLERADMMDVDVVIWDSADEVGDALGGPVYQTLDVHTQGREVVINASDGPVYIAYSFVSVLSIPFVVDRVVPRLAAALDGDPATPSDVSVAPPDPTAVPGDATAGPQASETTPPTDQ